MGPRLHLAGQLRAEAWQGRVEAGFFIADAALALGNAHLS